MGTILYELVVGKPPFWGANYVALLKAIERSEARLPPALAAQLSAPCQQLIYQVVGPLVVTLFYII